MAAAVDKNLGERPPGKPLREFLLDAKVYPPEVDRLEDRGPILLNWWVVYRDGVLFPTTAGA